MGLVTREVTANVVMDAEREFISVHPSSTDVVIEVFVPDGGDFGAIVPTGAQPTIDPNAIPASDLDALESATRPQVIVEIQQGGPLSGGESCGCGGATKGAAAPHEANPDGNVRTGPSVTVGPVTATPVSADTSTALNDWLSQNGFTYPVAQQSVIDGYVGAGRWFIAFKPSGAPGGGVSVGVHYTVPEVDRGVDMKIGQLGAASTMAFTAFIVDTSSREPDDAATITLSQLDPAVAQTSYSAAVAKAVTAANGEAWVIEGVHGTTVVTGALAPFVDSAATKVTRLSTVVTPAQLTYDATFNNVGPTPDPPSSVTLFTEGATASATPHRFGGSSALVALFGSVLFLKVGRRRAG
ncbi:MAG: DUF2330 domain-containing protein [Deltaproteobacteria bacterium]|nr:DUF2330 domain-containing protein [Deltaproteobacteria bacterium]